MAVTMMPTEVHGTIHTTDPVGRVHLVITGEALITMAGVLATVWHAHTEIHI